MTGLRPYLSSQQMVLTGILRENNIFKSANIVKFNSVLCAYNQKTERLSKIKNKRLGKDLPDKKENRGHCFDCTS